MASTDANTLGTGECGLADGSSDGDWRLPNVGELFGLVDYGRYTGPGSRRLTREIT